MDLDSAQSFNVPTIYMIYCCERQREVEVDQFSKSKEAVSGQGAHR
jgi:hypothetical protein